LPLPSTKERLTPKFLANFRTDGPACDFLVSLLTTLSPIGIGISFAAFFSGGSGAGLDGVCVIFSISSFFSTSGEDFISVLTSFFVFYSF